MKTGISAFAWTSNFRQSHLEQLPAMKQLGMDGVEIPMFDPVMLPVDEIRRAFEASDLECTVCAILPAGVNPISPDRETRRLAVAHLRRCIEASAAMGATLLGGPLYAPIGYLPEHRPTSEEWGWAVEAFQSITDDLERHSLRLALEPVNRSETFFLRTAQEAKRLCHAIGDPRIGVTIDTFHANIEERNLVQAIQSLGPRLFHIHASESDRGPLGLGHVPFEEIIEALREARYEGFLMIEGFGYDAGEMQSPGYLWAYDDVSPQKLAAESYAHLAGLLKK